MRTFIDHYQWCPPAKYLHLCGKQIIRHITKLAQKNLTLKRQKGDLLQMKFFPYCKNLFMSHRNLSNCCVLKKLSFISYMSQHWSKRISLHLQQTQRTVLRQGKLCPQVELGSLAGSVQLHTHKVFGHHQLHYTNWDTTLL